MQRQQATTQQQYLELLRHLVMVRVPPPLSVLTLALQSSGLQSQGQPSFQYTSPQQQVPQTFQSPSFTPIQTGFTPPAQLRPHLLSGTPFTDLSATYGELTGQPSPSYTTVVTTSEMSASEIAALLVSGAATTETLSSSVASTDPPTLGVFQAQAIMTALIVASTPSITAPGLPTQTASLPRLSTEGQPDSSESEEDTSQFVITPRSSTPDTTASVLPSDP
jgi:hypothetical protein